MDPIFGTPLSQSGRLLQLTTPLGANQLQALRAHGVERIGRPPHYTLDVLVQDTQYDPEKLIGQRPRLGQRARALPQKSQNGAELSYVSRKLLLPRNLCTFWSRQ